MHYSQDSQNINNILHLIQESPKGELYNFKSMYSCIYMYNHVYAPFSEKFLSLQLNPHKN